MARDTDEAADWAVGVFIAALAAVVTVLLLLAAGGLNVVRRCYARWGGQHPKLIVFGAVIAIVYIVAVLVGMAWGRWPLAGLLAGTASVVLVAGCAIADAWLTHQASVDAMAESVQDLMDDAWWRE